jgi:hypothetical protein
MQKRCNLWRRFFLRTLKNYFSIFKCFLVKYLLFPNSRHILLLGFTFYPPLFVSTNVSNSLQLSKHNFWTAANSTQASILARKENYEMLGVSLNIRIGINK